MFPFVSLFTESAREFKKVRTLTMCGLMAALALILNSFSIQIGLYNRISFADLPNEMVDFLFGPFVGGFFSAILDIFKLILKPTGPWIPGLTLNAFLAGLIYGFFLYKKPIRLWRILVSKLIVAVLINIVLGTFWLSQMYGDGFLVSLPNRIFQNLTLWPIQSLLLYLVLKLLEKSGALRMFGIFKLK